MVKKDLIGNKIPGRDYDISILLIDHDTESTASLTSMLEQFSSKVMSVNVASKAVSIIEKQKNIGLVIANIETPHIDSHSFHTLLLHKDIPLILISPEEKMKNASQLLTNRERYFLKKPVSEKDIKNMWQHVVLPKKRQESGKSKIVKTEDDDIMEERVKQIEAFRESLKRQRTTSQASLLGKRPFMGTSVATPETYQKRRSEANATKPVSKMESIVGRGRNLWTRERHMKFLSAVSILGDKDSHPKSILKSMNDPDLTHSQVASHLQKYKAQVERMNDTLSRNEWRSTDKTFEYPSDYEYPFIASNLAKNFISAKKPTKERGKDMLKFLLGGKMDLSNHSSFGNVDCVPSATSNIPTCSISPTIDSNHTGLDSTSLSSSNLPCLPGLPSRVGASNTYAFQMGYTPQPNPSHNPFQSPSSILDQTGRNQTNSYLTSMPDGAHVPQGDLNHMGESYNVLPDYTMNQMNWVSAPESYVLPEANMNVIFPQTNTNQMGRVSLGERYVSSENMITSAVQEGFIHCETSYAALNSVILPEANMTISQTNMNHMGNTSFGESSVLSQDRIKFYETNTTRVSLVSRGVSNGIYSETNMTIRETNINQRTWISSRESDVLPQDMVPSETITTQAGLVPCHGTSMEEQSLARYDEGDDVPIEDMIAFDSDVNNMDMQTLLGSSGSSEGNILSNTYIGHDSSSTTQMERGDNFHDDRELMDWVDNLLTEG